MTLETKLADASLDNVTLRDPAAVDHKTTFDALQRSRRTSTGHRTSRGASAHSDLNVIEPKFLPRWIAS